MATALNRAFPYQAFRIGSQGAKFFTPLRCYKCGTEKVHESFKALPDEVIAKRFSQWGWVIGRNRNYDVCPTCVGVKAENRLAQKFKVVTEQGTVPTPLEVAQGVQQSQSYIKESIAKSKQERRLLEVLEENNSILKENQTILKEWLWAMTLKQKAPTKKVRASKKSESVSKSADA